MNAAALLVLLTLAPAQQERRGTPHATTRKEPHTFGLGGTLSISNRGAGGAMRYWIADRVGLDLNLGWHRGYRFSSTTSTSSTFVAAPSMIVLFGKADATKEVNFRPFVGAGLTYLRGGGFNQPITGGSTGVTTTGSLTQRTGGTGEQAFGGIEMTFKEWPSIALSAEVAYYRLPIRLSSGAVADGINYFILFHYYLR